jgi:hypothetical protein
LAAAADDGAVMVKILWHPASVSGVALQGKILIYGRNPAEPISMGFDAA